MAKRAKKIKRAKTRKAVRRVMKEKKTVSNIVTILMVLSGMLLFVSLISSPMRANVSMQGQQLAPPMPNYWILAFIGVLVVGTIYFMVRARMRKMQSIPLSF